MEQTNRRLANWLVLGVLWFMALSGIEGPLVHAQTVPERYRVPIEGAPVLGPREAKITLVEFTDYQCPFCSRAEQTVTDLQKEYGKDLRVVVRNYPLPFHNQAKPAARAAMAARLQGEAKFWAFHRTAFEKQELVSEGNWSQIAEDAGLDIARFTADLAKQAAIFDDRLRFDEGEVKRLGVTGTPTFFVNGRIIRGAQAVSVFKEVFAEELKTTGQLTKAGTKPKDLYAALQKGALERAKDESPKQAGDVFKQAPEADLYQIRVGDAPVRGPQNAKVTIIVFSDFECPFCARVTKTLDKILEIYGNDVRLAFKHNPLPFHPHAEGAALAAIAAGKQGKFWEMHDRLFSEQKQLEEKDLEAHAKALKLDPVRFRAAMKDPKSKALIKADQEDAARFGARGTPSFFINGRAFSGAQPLERFRDMIDKELRRAHDFLAAGVKPGDLYNELIKDGSTKATTPPPPKPAPRDMKIYKAEVLEAPVRGPKDALVTIVTWSDFQCPFCSRVQPTLNQVLQQYPNEVRLVFKNQPLPFHGDAMLAAEAALAAQEQGRFWPMHDKLFAEQKALKREDLERYAKELGLDLVRFKRALDDHRFKPRIEKESKIGNQLGARGTPSFFINGRIFVGAQPLEVFKERVEESLKEARALQVNRRIGPDQVYAELMKDAISGANPTPVEDGDQPEEDKTIYKVDPGPGPSWGPMDAKVVIVEFGDFQCPFCARVQETLTQLKAKYPGKVRLVFRHYPLPFHQNAPLAAEAAMAAHAQGKFWEMHDKLYTNVQALDRKSLEKYAGELKLDMKRFRADLDLRKHRSVVENDKSYADSLSTDGIGTPTFFINGRKVEGAYPLSHFSRIIDEILAAKPLAAPLK